MRLVFVRHGETYANAEERLQGRDDTELSPVGRAQVEKLSRRFEEEGFNPTHAYSSPLRRAAHTAEILTRRWPVAAEPWRDLMEYDIGVASGMTWEEIVEKYPGIDRELEASRGLAGVEGAEPLADRRARAQRVIDAVLSRHAHGDVVLLVTHGGILQQLLAVLLGTSRTWGLRARNSAVFDFSIDLDRWSMDGDVLLSTAFWRIARFNDTVHLD